MRRSELALLTVLVFFVALTVFVVAAMYATHGAHHDQLGSVITSFQGDGQ